MVEVVARIFQGIEFLRWGVVTNWWGLVARLTVGPLPLLLGLWLSSLDFAVDFALVLSWAIISLDFT
jgi:hypothetical protein